MIIAVLLVVFIIAGVILLWFQKYLQIQKCIPKYNGPTPLPVFGNIFSITSSRESIPMFQKLYKQYGSVFKFWIGFRPRLVVCDPKVAEFILGSTRILDKNPEYQFLHSWLGTGLLTSTGAKWKKRRKLLTPAFHFQILEQFIPIFNAQSEILRERLLLEVDNGPIDIFPYIGLLTLDTICEAAMGTQVNAQKQCDSRYVRCVKELCKLFPRRTLSILKGFDSCYRFSKDYQKEKEYLLVLHGHTDAVIKSRHKEILMSIEKNKECHKNIKIKKRMAFLDLLLQCRVDGEPLTDDEIREEVDTFMFEGHDTTTSGISFTLYCLSKNPVVQERAVQELHNIFKDGHSDPTYQDLQDMRYLEMVIKETLRFYPPVPFYGRQVQEDIQFEGGTLPKGLSLIIFPLGMHMEEKVFPHPEKFEPERFSAENSIKRSPFSYLPFSAGPRNCIGQRFAMLEMKSTISKILRSFVLLAVTDHTPELISETILKTTNGLLIGLKKRDF